MKKNFVSSCSTALIHQIEKQRVQHDSVRNRTAPQKLPDFRLRDNQMLDVLGIFQLRLGNPPDIVDLHHITGIMLNRRIRTDFPDDMRIFSRKTGFFKQFALRRFQRIAVLPINAASGNLKLDPS